MHVILDSSFGHGIVLLVLLKSIMTDGLI